MSHKEALEVFGLDKHPDAETLKKRHRELSIKHHPDKGGSQEQMARINVAREVLSKAPDSRVKVTVNPTRPRPNSGVKWSTFYQNPSGRSGVEEMFRNAWGISEDEWEKMKDGRQRRRSEEEDFMKAVRWSEATFQEELRQVLVAVGVYVFNIVGHPRQGSGWPDLHLTSPHWTGWLELKVDGHQLEPKQRQRIKEIRRRGSPAYAMRYVNADKQVVIEDHMGLMKSQFKWDGDGKKLIQRLRGVAKKDGFLMPTAEEVTNELVD